MVGVEYSGSKTLLIVEVVQFIEGAGDDVFQDVGDLPQNFLEDAKMCWMSPPWCLWSIPAIS
jgi:hypothetical protein